MSRLGVRLCCWVVGIASLAGAAPGQDMTVQDMTASEYGPQPTLAPVQKSLVPTTHISKAVGWPAGARPTPYPGTTVTAYASGLDHPRWLYVLPNGDVLVAESQAPPKPDDAKGLRGLLHKLAMKHGGSGARPSANRITLLRGISADGSAAEKHIFLQGLNSPYGMALIGNNFYVANTDAVLRFPYHAGETEIREQSTKVVDLPAGTINHHWTKSLIASPGGQKLYAGVGSNSNAGENGLAAESERAAVWEIDPATGSHRVFASGLRNPNGLAWEPRTGVLWVVVNERDELGNQLPPDYMTGLQEGAFYGFPFSYYGQHVDERARPPNPEMVARAIVPQYALGAHTASLGLCWSEDPALLPAALHHGMFVGQHGSWNRRPYSGYRVIFVPFDKGQPTGLPVVVMQGFLNEKGDAQGRPVGVTLDKRGALLVADDVGDTVWRLTSSPDR